MSNKNKKKEGIVYSTDPNFTYQQQEKRENKSLPPEQQTLIIQLDKKQRKGKVVTLISGFAENEDDLKALGKWLKTKCGSGGTVKDDQILIQGEFRDTVSQLLQEKGYKTKKSGG